MTATEALRQTTAKYLMPYLLIHIPLVWLTGFVTGNDTLISLVLVSVFALVPVASWRMTGVGPLTRYLTAASFMLIVAVLVYAFRGHPWQIDIHMYFFAGLAMLLGLADWRVFVVATGVVAVHHLALNFTVPYWVFPQGADFFRVVLHAVIVVVETIVLAFGTLKLVASLDEASEAVRKAEEASTRAEENSKQATVALEKAEAAQKEVEAASKRQVEMEERAKQEREAELERIAAQFEEEVGGVVSSVNHSSTRLRELAISMTEGSADVQGSAENASRTTDGISGNVDAVAAASEELAVSVEEITRQLARANATTTSAVDQSTRATENFANLAKRVEDISEFVNVIREIAQQINLLALNATIEAARAGEAGKGFAVVASEVGNLATQSAKATEKIESQINAVVTSTEQTTGDITGIAAAIEELRDVSATISAAIEEQGSATRGIANNATETAGAVAQFSEMVGRVKDGVSKNTDQAQEVLSASDMLQSEADNLSQQVHGFVAKLRAS